MRAFRFEAVERRLDRVARKLAYASLSTRLLLATTLVAAAAVARAGFAGYVDSLSPYATFYLAVDVSALLGGLSAGLFACAASALAAHLWFAASLDAGFGLFVAGGVLFSLLADLIRRAWLASEARRAMRAPAGASSSPAPTRDCLDTVGGTAAALAHEVNQPLAATVTYLKVARRLLEKSPSPHPEIIEVLDKAAEQTLRAGRIVTSLRDLVRRREPDKTLVGLNALIGEAIGSPEISAACANVSIGLEKGARFDRTLVDREQIRQVIVGLARNALEAMRAAKTRRLVISTSNPDDHTIRVDVIDTGCGLPDSWADGAFVPFATTKTNGMGVGLSISRSIIERHDGRIWAAPNQDGGAVFSFILPLEESDIDA
jgi:signal transduction histidine kinase